MTLTFPFWIIPAALTMSAFFIAGVMTKLEPPVHGDLPIPSFAPVIYFALAIMFSLLVWLIYFIIV